MLIGLCGPEGCGKNTLAGKVVNHDAYEKYAMDGPIKNMLRQFHIQDDVWEDRDLKDTAIPWLGKSPSYLAHTLETDWGRNLVDPDIWVLFAQGRWHHLDAAGDGRMIISNVRFKNEAEWIAKEGGLLIQIVRPETLIMDNPTHFHEHGVPPALIDAAILNDASTSELYNRFWEKVHVLVQ